MWWKLSALLVLCALCAADNVTGTGQPATRSSSYINALQWNPHWECWADAGDGCGQAATSMIRSLVTTYNVDFANIVEIGEVDMSWVPSGYGVVVPPNTQYPPTCGWDITVLIYKASVWDLESSELVCMDGSDRPAIVASFKRKFSNFPVIVVGAHYPHSDVGDKVLANSIQNIGGTGDLNLLLIADTNSAQSNSGLLESLEVPNAGQGNRTGSNDRFLTCCYHDGYVYNFDRIIANFGTSMESSLPVMHKAGDCAPSDYEKSFVIWDRNCQQIQDEWGVCTNDYDENHQLVMEHCPSTCAIARGQCGYVRRNIGNCADGYEYIETWAACQAAASVLGLEGWVSTIGLPSADRPHGCYLKPENQNGQKLWFNSDGDRYSTDYTRVSICNARGVTAEAEAEAEGAVYDQFLAGVSDSSMHKPVLAKLLL